MADRTSAAIFGKIFTILAQNPTEERKGIARKVWDESRRYDFTPDQMYVDEALVALDLARLKVDPKHPEWGEIWLYGPEGYKK